MQVEHRAEQVWVVYPRTRNVMVCKAEGASEARSGEMLEFRGVTIPVAEIFVS